jgi:mannosyltransferase
MALSEQARPETPARDETFFRVAAALGVLLSAFAILLPSATLVGLLREDSANAPSEIWLGATIFKATLAVLGLAIIAVGRLPAGSARAPEPAEADPQAGRHNAILAGLLLAALALRLYALNTGLWLDEIITRVLFIDLPLGTIVSTYENENQHFLYSILAHASVQLFGDHAWALRLPAALFGVGSIWALFLLGRQLGNATEALLAAALLTFSYTHIWFSQNARGYSGLLFWALLASWLLVRALEEERPRIWPLYAGAAALGVYTHTTMLFVVLGHFLIYLRWLVTGEWKERARWVGVAAGFALAALLTVVLHALALPQMLGTAGREPSLVAEWKNPLWAALEIAQGLRIGFGGVVVAMAALGVFAAGLWSYLRSRPILLELLFYPPLLGAAVVISLGHHVWPRFFFFAMGFAVLVVIRGAVVVGETAGSVLGVARVTPRQVGTGFACALVAISAVAVPVAYGPKQDYQAAQRFVEENMAPGDAVVTAGLAVFPYKRWYRVPWAVVESEGDLADVRAGSKRTWIVYTLPQVLASVNPGLMKTIERDFPLVREFPGTLARGSIVVRRSVQQSGEEP